MKLDDAGVETFGPETPADELVATGEHLEVRLVPEGDAGLALVRRVHPVEGSGLTVLELLRACAADEAFRSVDAGQGLLTRTDADGRTVLLARYDGTWEDVWAGRLELDAA